MGLGTAVLLGSYFRAIFATSWREGILNVHIDFFSGQRGSVLVNVGSILDEVNF
jgi:hypothetical protein